eukprot:TRINITY_DN52175_c0_g1_i1.p1 TRINITY_DN52175_c0_g1~~TRINITY_DN52175_c0_g1_i1.p1  ORF type:complete len:636 (+),score=240.45 TRINITY_DN52175_c0_g1_i1:230-1909(+)
MDSNEIEKERGITILAKNTCIELPNNTINILDTPGHADFAGEVERALQMLEGFILLVDAAEGPKPGTRYVLRKALELNLKPVVVINKIDRSTPEAIEATCDKIESLFLELATHDDQLEYPVLYGSGRSGYMNTDPEKREGTLQPLFDTILETVPPPQESKPDLLQAQVTSIEVKGKGKKFYTIRMRSGSIHLKDEVFVSDFFHPEKALYSFKVQALSKFQGLDRLPTDSAEYGDILVLSGDNVDKLDIQVGHTLCMKNKLAPLPYKPLDEPTFMITLHPNRSALAGRDGSKFGGPEIRARLVDEAVRNLAMRLDIKGPDEFVVSGRGLLHLGVLFEEMRREGFEMELARPTVLMKEIDGKKHEPWDCLSIRCESQNADDLASLMFANHAEQVSQDDVGGGWSESVWHIPGRCMVGTGGRIRSAGGATLNMTQELLEYRPFNEEIVLRRETGSLLSTCEGVVSIDGLNTISKHGLSFVTDRMQVYLDQIVGQRASGAGDMTINVTKAANSWADANKRPPFQIHTLETALEYIQDDEYVEVTPMYVRMRKKARTGKGKGGK